MREGMREGKEYLKFHWFLILLMKMVSKCGVLLRRLPEVSLSFSFSFSSLLSSLFFFFLFLSIQFLNFIQIRIFSHILFSFSFFSFLFSFFSLSFLSFLLSLVTHHSRREAEQLISQVLILFISLFPFFSFFISQKNNSILFLFFFFLFFSFLFFFFSFLFFFSSFLSFSLLSFLFLFFPFFFSSFLSFSFSKLGPSKREWKTTLFSKLKCY